MSTEDSTNPLPPKDPPSLAHELAVRLVDSSELFRGQREVWIRHGAETYRIRITRNDKLILQK